jgi:uncharacterized membrane protein HdeD (DUF308 family)
METLDDYKSEFMNLKAKPLASSPDGKQSVFQESLLRAVKRQDRADKSLLLYKRILPISAGIIILTLVFILTHFPNNIILTGSIIVYLGLLSILSLFLRDYIGISKDDFGESIRDYFDKKRKRIQRWRRIPVLYNIIYGFYIVGVLLIILGNTNIPEVFKDSKLGVIVFTSMIIGSFIVSGIIGEIKYRKRYMEEHQPLISEINRLLNELNDEEELST